MFGLSRTKTIGDLYLILAVIMVTGVYYGGFIWLNQERWNIEESYNTFVIDYSPKQLMELGYTQEEALEIREKKLDRFNEKESRLKKQRAWLNIMKWITLLLFVYAVYVKWDENENQLEKESEELKKLKLENKLLKIEHQEKKEQRKKKNS